MKKIKLPKFKFPIKITLTKKAPKKDKQQAKKAFLSNIITRYKKVLTITLIVILGLFILDAGTFLFFKTNVLGYSTKSGIIVTKRDVINRIMIMPEYSNINLQQIINDVAIQQMTKAIAKENKKYMNKKQILAELKKQGIKDEEITADLLHNAQIILMIESMLTKQPKEVTEKDMKAFYEQTKKTYFNGKKYDEVKEQIKQYLEAQNKQQVIYEWIQDNMKKENFVLTKESLKNYQVGSGLKLFYRVILKHCLKI